MSADNYLYVRQLPDGLFAVDHRSASSYYADEGVTLADLPDYADETWIIEEARPIMVFDTAQEALGYAWGYERENIVEYGVSVAFEVQEALTRGAEPAEQASTALKGEISGGRGSSTDGEQ